MASLLNALQLALGAGGAGISGYQRAQAQREEEERLKREEARRVAAEQKAAERQLKMDERQEMLDKLQLMEKGALPSAQRQEVVRAAAGEIAKAVSGAMGAFQGGPLTPFDSEAIARGAGRMGAPAAQFTIGKTTFDMPDPEQRRLAKEAQETAARLRERAETQRLDEEGDIRKEQRITERTKTLASAAKKGGRNSEAAMELATLNPSAYRVLFPEQPTLSPEAQLEERNTREEAVAWFNTPTDPEDRARIAAAFNRIRGSAEGGRRPAVDIITQLYRAEKSRPKPPRQTAQDKFYEALGSNAIPVAPTLGEAVGGGAAQPTEEQALWDQAVAQYGRERVLKEYGPRP